MKTLTIRNIPNKETAFPSERSESEDHAMNAVAESPLMCVDGLETEHRKRRDLSWLTGSWTKEEASKFDETVADCRKASESSRP